MHEVSVALGVLEGVEASARAAGIERVTGVRLRVGALSGIVKDALVFAWDVTTEHTLAEGSELSIEEIPLAVLCEHCESEREPVPGTGLVCPNCGNVCPHVVRGRELELVAMEVPA